MFNNLSLSVRVGEKNFGKVHTKIGLPQGDTCSPGLFSLFTSDLPDILKNEGATLAGVKIPIISYADDMVILSNLSEELQMMLNKLCRYLSSNGLFMNTNKTKVMRFQKGPKDGSKFYANGVELEEVNEFDYLGITLTPQLSYAKHIQKINIRARSRIGQIFTQTPILNCSIDLALKLFNIYILPLYEYGMAIWTSRVPKTSRDEMNAVFTKYLKRYLQIPPYTNNEIAHFLCGTVPLTKTLFENPTKPLQSINLSIPIPGHQLHLIKNQVSREEDYFPSDLIPNLVLARCAMLSKLPSNQAYRWKASREIFDLDHRTICKQKEFHSKPDVTSCVCIHCNQPMNWYHICLWCDISSFLTFSR